MVNVLDSDIEENEFQPQSHYCIQFRTNNLGNGMNPLTLSVLGYIVPLQFYKNDFGFK